MDGDAISHLAKRCISAVSTTPMLHRIDRDATAEDAKVPSLDDWDLWMSPERFDEPPPAGRFYVETVEELFKLRTWFIQAGRVPRAAFSDLTSRTKFTYYFNRLLTPATPPGS